LRVDDSLIGQITKSPQPEWRRPGLRFCFPHKECQAWVLEARTVEQKISMAMSAGPSGDTRPAMCADQVSMQWPITDIMSADLTTSICGKGSLLFLVLARMLNLGLPLSSHSSSLSATRKGDALPALGSSRVSNDRLKLAQTRQDENPYLWPKVLRDWPVRRSG
jgi:hypothetical protein